MTNGLFMNPQQALAAERRLREQQAIQAGASPLGAAGQELGRTLGGAFGAAFGAPVPESPEVQMARARTGILQQADLSTRAGAFEAAKSLRDAGDLQGFMSLTQHGLNIDIPESQEKFGKFKRLANEQGEPMPFFAQVGKGGELKNLRADPTLKKTKIDVNTFNLSPEGRTELAQAQNVIDEFNKDLGITDFDFEKGNKTALIGDISSRARQIVKEGKGKVTFQEARRQAYTELEDTGKIGWEDYGATPIGTLGRRRVYNPRGVATDDVIVVNAEDL